MVDAKAAILVAWMDAGQIRRHDPYHLIFSIWAITQHFADFAVQVDAITSRTLDDPAFFEATVAGTQSMILSTLGLE